MSNSFSSELVALLAVLGLGFVLRWVFRPSRRRTGPIPHASDARELGLLTVIRTAVPRVEAQRLLGRLTERGLRASLSRRQDGSMDLLVFHTDVDQARNLLDPGSE